MSYEQTNEKEKLKQSTCLIFEKYKEKYQKRKKEKRIEKKIKIKINKFKSNKLFLYSLEVSFIYLI